MPNLCVFIKKRSTNAYIMYNGARVTAEMKKKGVYKKKLEIVTHIQERVRKNAIGSSLLQSVRFD